jgi:hypothetical protein
MSFTLKLVAASTALFFSTTTAFAEVPPSCPGGGTATGKPSCTGPIFNPVCTEGPPWTCTIKDDKPATLEVGDGGTPRPPRLIDLLPPTSLSDSGGYQPSPGGGGGGGSRPSAGEVGSTTNTTLSTGGSSPSFL